MKISCLIALLVAAAIAVPENDQTEVYSAFPEGARNKRSIGKFFSDFFKRFQKKDRRRVVYYTPPEYGGHYAASQNIHSFGPPPQPHYNGPYQAHHPSHVQPADVGGSYGGGGHGGGHHGGGHGAGHDGGYGGGDHGGFHGGGGGGYGGDGHIEIQVSNPHGHGDHGLHGGDSYGSGSGGHGSHIPHGFGPLKHDDVIQVGGSSGSYLPPAPHIESDSYGAPAIQPDNSYAAPPQDIYGAPGPVVPDSYAPPDPRVPGGGHPPPHAPSPSYQEPATPIVTDSYNVPNVPTFASNAVGAGQGGPGYKPFIDTPIDNAYKPPAGAHSLPLAPHEGVDPSLGLDLNYKGPSNSFQQVQPVVPFQAAGTYQQPSISVAGQGQKQRNQNILVNGNTGREVTYSSPLGPDDPIIEIIFQDADPLPRAPPPRIDPKLYEPPQDDVEVFFIEYSPEDNLNDLQSLDLTGARPAILQDLPTELPYELRNELLTSGVLQNANIEVIDLQNAITDKSLDSRTRNLLQNYYTRPRTHRQVSPFNEQDNETEEDVRVRRIKNKSNTPEGVIEVAKGLEKFRRGKFAGVVEVNDKNSENFLPVEVDGRRFPLPENIPLKDKELSGVLLLAPGGQGKKQNRQSPFFFTNQQPIASASEQKPQNKKRRDVQVDLDNTGWVPIVDS